MKVAIDAMGGDFGPPVVVPGALMAAEDLGLVPVFVGKKEEIEKEIRGFSGKYEIVHTNETIGMDESPLSVIKGKKRSSIRVGIELHKDGYCDGFISAGNSGAVLALALHILGKIKGVERPAIMTLFPTVGGSYVILLDMGGNVDCKPKHLFDFALMGSIYAEKVLRKENPRVGILSNGEERSKGNKLTKESYALFEGSNRINFIGYVEGKDIFFDKVDVVVCDGFVGNIVLKVTEGVAEAIYHFLRMEISKSIPAKIGMALARGAIKRFLRKVDYAEYGGAPLLGIDGVCFISHGRSSKKAIRNGIQRLYEFCKLGVLDLMKEGFSNSL